MRRIAGVLIAIFVFAPAGARADTTKDKAKETSQQQAQETKENYLKRVNEEVHDWSTRIKSLEERSRKSGSRVRAELDNHIRAMRSHFEEVQKGLRELTGAGDGAWNNLRRSVEESRQKLDKDYDKAVSAIKTTEKRVSDKARTK